MELGLHLCFSIAALGYFSATLLMPNTMSMVTAAAECNKTCYTNGTKSCSETCQCYHGFKGNNCLDMDECADNLRDVCLNRGWCANTQGAFNCTCLTGWKGKHCEKRNDSQSQVSPLCMEGYSGDNCDTLKGCGHANGRNISGNLTCLCHDGWTHTGGNRPDEPCNTDINECDNRTKCVHGTCTNTDGSYSCNCDEGYAGQTCSHHNACLTGNVCANEGTCVFKTRGPRWPYIVHLSHCITTRLIYIHFDPCELIKSTPPDYECKCQSGWQGQNCSDISTPKPTNTPKLTTTPKPTIITTLKPTTITPKPTIITTPKPTTITPKPTIITTPKPTTITPKLTTTPTPAIITTPKPATTTPEPITTPTPTPEPITIMSTRPKPTTTTPKTTTSTHTAKTLTTKPTTATTNPATMTTTRKTTITTNPTTTPTQNPTTTSTVKSTTTPANATAAQSTAGSPGTNVPLVAGLVVGGASVMGALVTALVFFYKRWAFQKIAPIIPGTNMVATSGGPNEHTVEIKETFKMAVGANAKQPV